MGKKSTEIKYDFNVYQKYGEPTDFDGYIEKLKSIISVVQSAIPSKPDWAILGTSEFVPIDLENDNFSTVISSNYKGLDNQREYPRVVEAGNSDEKIFSSTGFSTSFYFIDRDSNETRPESETGVRSLRIRLGGQSAQFSGLQLSFPDISDLSNHGQVDQLKKMMMKLVDANGCKRAGLRSHSFRKAYQKEMMQYSDEHVNTYGVNEGQIDVGLLTYINYPPLLNYLPDDIDYVVTPNEGVLITLTSELLDVESAQQLKQAQRIHRLLESVHLQQSEYAIEGWPPDQNERDYEHKITGSPDERKYLVEFCYFDGYDASRDVLLYAKLFAITGVPEVLRSNNLVCIAILAEARRQIAAVELAGKPTLIEWHIGIEEHAKRIAELFQRESDITKDQIQVIYTPAS